MLGYLAALLFAGPVPTGTQVAARPVPCSFTVATPAAERFSCYRVPVPRDHARPEKGVYELAVAVRRPLAPRPGATPVIVINGGPGGRSFTGSKRVLDLDLDPGAPLVLFDQRGAGISEPKPCPDAAEGLTQIVADDRPWADTVRLVGDKWRSCRPKLDAAGVDPRDFGTSVTTDDIEALRRALGVERWNIYTGSYGSAVAMDLMAARPGTVRAVVMFGITPPEGMPDEPDSALDVALKRRAALCRAEPTCRAAHPDLLGDHARAIRLLDAAPLRLTVPGLGLADERFALSGRELEFVVDELMLDAAMAERMPELIAAALRRDASVWSPVLARFFARFDAQDVFGRLAVHCRDKARYHRVRDTERGAILGQLPDVCPHWSALGPVRRMPDDTKIPTLIMAGELDTTTPSRNAEIAAGRLGRSATLLLFPKASHTIGLDPGCEQEIVKRFLADPKKPIGRGCGAR